MKVLITGAGGYLAWELINQLSLKEEIHVTAATSRPEKLKTDSNYKNVSLVCNEDLFGMDFSGFDAIIHTAFCRMSNGALLMESLLFSKKLFQKAVRDGAGAIINISSQSVYGSKKEILPDETGIYEPGYLYALAKASSELILETAVENSLHRTGYTNIRMASLVGPGKTVPVNVIYKLAENALNGQDLVIEGGRQKFSFIDVRDAAAAIIKMLDLPVEKWERVINLGPEKQTGIMELAECAVKCATAAGAEPVRIVLNAGDIPLNTGMESEKLYMLLKWRPRYTIEDILKATIEYIQTIA